MSSPPSSPPAKKHVQVGDIDCGSDPMFLIAGPCVIEAEPLMMRTKGSSCSRR